MEPDKTEREMGRAELAGLFLLMTGFFTLLGSAYFFYDGYTQESEESTSHGITMAVISGVMLLVGGLLKSRLLEPIDPVAENKRRQEAAANSVAEPETGRFRFPRILIWFLMPILIWVLFGRPVPYFLLRSMIAEDDMPKFNFIGMTDDDDLKEMQRDQEYEEEAVPVGE